MHYNLTYVNKSSLGPSVIFIGIKSLAATICKHP